VSVRGPLSPGATLGVLGAGQLGRMFAAAAVRMGYRVHVFAPDANAAPAAAHAVRTVEAGWDDEAALARFAEGVDAVTIEFENIPSAALETVARHVPVRPGPQALHVAQHRGREKAFLASLGLPLAPWTPVASADDAAGALAELGRPALLKTAGFGYDGKGQAALGAADEVADAWARIGGGPAVLEGRVELAAELSVVVARDGAGRTACFEAARNHHVGGILDVSAAPSGLPGAVTVEAREAAVTVAEALELEGVACVEFFLGEDGRLRVNEIAPRPHNSGHLTIEGAATSQFEQQVRTTAGLPLGDPSPRAPAAMANLLGDLWTDGPPDWTAALAHPGVALHLYGKAEPRPGRKMGHLTVLADDPGSAERKARAARAALGEATAGTASGLG
jgi:5-(carboxyamino)imidazole ribonucleotide synthase